MSATGRSGWSRHTEQASRAGLGHDLAAARRRFRALDRAQQLRLVHEIALTRAAELTLAYRNLVMVASGHKYKRRADGREQRQTLPCVVFVVRRKWAPGAIGEADPQRLPRELLAFADAGPGRRVLCAVPTDVQLEARYCGARANAARAVAVDTPEREFGSLTCAVQLRSGGKTRRLLMSAQHVFSPVPELDPTALRAQVALRPLGPAGVDFGVELGRTEAIGGRLRSAPAMSFDVQLASPASTAGQALAAMLRGVPLSAAQPFVASFDDFAALGDQGFEVLVPDNHPDAGFKPRPPLLAVFDTFMPPAFSIGYRVRRGGVVSQQPIRHFELLQLKLKAKRRTLPGDSGSPVVLWRDDGDATLVGMHIGGDAGLSYVLPAWQLFDLDNYWQAPAGTLKPVSL